MTLQVREREIVIPGDTLAKGMDFLPSKGTMRDGDEIVATVLGMVRVDGKVVKIIPLEGEYLPKANDIIIAQVSDVVMSGWIVKTFSPYSAMLPISQASSSYIEKGEDLTQYFDIGDFLATKITNVTSQKLVDLTMMGPGLRKLGKGRIIKANTNKVPRIIGKQGSMVSLIKQATNTQIVVGQNGMIWISGEDPKKEQLAIQAIRKIEKDTHISGLTETMEKWLQGGAQ